MRVCVFYNKLVTWEEPREVGKFVDGINVRLKGSFCRRSKSFRLDPTCLITLADAFARNHRDVGRTSSGGFIVNQTHYYCSHVAHLMPTQRHYSRIYVASAQALEIRSTLCEISTKKVSLLEIEIINREWGKCNKYIQLFLYERWFEFWNTKKYSEFGDIWNVCYNREANLNFVKISRTYKVLCHLSIF